MSGQAGARGYLIQAVISLLDALGNADWTECVLEPTLGDDKIDLLFRFEKGDRVSQIKSSINAVGAADVRKWATALEVAYPTAAHYELRLVGPVTGNAASIRSVGKVEVPTPQILNIRALVEQCAHRLDAFLRIRGHGPTRPIAREFLAKALATHLGQLSAGGETLSRHDLEQLLASWIAELLPSDASDDVACPHQMPAPPDDFVGRDAELLALKEAARRDDIRTVIIHGLTGIGKSALAAHAAAELASSFPNGQVYIDLKAIYGGHAFRDCPEIEIIQAFRSTYPSHGDASRAASDLRTLLNCRRVLILVENVKTASQIAGLIPPTSESLLIITTQHRFDLPGAVSIAIDVLSPDDGTRLVRSISDSTKEYASALAEACGHLPLAIRIACGTVNSRPDISVENYVQRLAGIDHRAKLVSTALDVSCSDLSPQASKLLRAAAAFAMDCDAIGIATILQCSLEAIDDALAVVIGRHLLEWDDHRQRYHLHDLVRAYILSISDESEIADFQTRLAQYFAVLCERIEELYREGGESVFAALDLFDSESTNIGVSFLYCSSHVSEHESAAEVCLQFVQGLTHVVDLRLAPLARAEVFAFGLKAAGKLEDVDAVIQCTGNLGRAYRELGQLELSLECHKYVLQKATEPGHKRDQAYAHHHIGLVLLKQGDRERGVDHLEKSLELCREPQLAMKLLEVHTLNNLGTVFLETMQPARAVERFRAAFDLAKDLNDPRSLAQSLANLGNTLLALGVVSPCCVGP